MRLGIDLDGVVADFNSGGYGATTGSTAPNCRLTSVKAWDAIPSLTHFEDMGEFWKWARDHDGHTLFRHLDTYPGAVDALWELGQKRHEIVIITTKPFWAIHDTFAWIGQHRDPDQGSPHQGRQMEVACDVYLDDGPHVIESLVRNRPEADRLPVCTTLEPARRPAPRTSPTGREFV